MGLPETAGLDLAGLRAPLREALAQRLLALADDELILAHRNSEWCGHAPILEEDIAFANIAQDELGHAGLWYALLQQLDGSDPDRLVFFRPAEAFRHVRMVELPNGDWAFSMLRQFLFDSYEMLHLQHLAGGAFAPLAQAAAKAHREEIYHLRHTRAWVQRLGLGTAESRRRMQAALDALWPHARQLFRASGSDSLLVEAHIMPSLARLHDAWLEEVVPLLTSSGLNVPQDESRAVQDGREAHTEHLAALLEELQSVARMDPDAVW